MKKTLLLSALAVVLSLTACNKEIAENGTPAPSVGQTVRFTSVAPETKAAFTTPNGTHYPVLWTSNDTQMAVTMNYSSSPVTADVTRFADNKTASFNAEFDNEGTAFKFVAVSPASAVKSVATSNKRVNIEVPSGQTPTATSPDEKAMVLYAKSDEFDTFPASVDMDFHHFTGYVHLVFTNYADALADAGATVQSVSITSDKEIAGRVFFFPETGTTEANAMSKTVTVTTSSLDDVWVALAPVDLSNETLSITIGTDKGTISKDVGFSSGCNLTSGKIAKVTVDLNGIDVVAPVRYNQVTNVNQLYVGDKVIITAARYDRVLSTTQNSNNRSATTITKGDGFILDPADVVEVLTLEDGVKPGEFAMKGKDNKYLYAPTGGNYLRSTATVNASQASLGSFAISIPASGQDSDKIDISYPAIMYVSASDHYIRYNNNSDGKGGYYNLFSTYAQSSSTKYVHLYRLDASPDLSPRFKASMPDDTDGDGDLDIVAAGGSLEVYVFGNSAWTASATGGATLDSASGTGNAILTLTVPANAGSSPKAYSVTVSTSAGVVPSYYTFNLTQGTSISLGAILFEDDFEWLQPYVDAWLAANTSYTENDLDPVGQNASTHQQPNIWNVNDLATSVGAEFESTRGYTDLKKSAKTLYMQHNYFKMGASNKQTGIKLPAIVFGTTPRDVMLSFDWCAHMNTSSVVDNTPLVVVLEGAGTCDDSGTATSNSIVSGQPAGKLEWQHVTLRLNDVTNDTRISIKPNHDGFTWSGQHRWHLDNLKVQEIN